MAALREPSDDAALVRRLQTGTREQAHAASQVLVERHQPRLFLHLAAKGLTHPEQQDVANETWERAWRLIGDFEYRGVGIFAWLRAIADHVAQEQFKRRFFGAALGEAQFELADPAADDPEASVLQRLTMQERRAVLLTGARHCAPGLPHRHPSLLLRGADDRGDHGLSRLVAE